MALSNFDAIAYYDELIKAGFTEAQAKAQIKALQKVIKFCDDASCKELAPKGDIRSIREEIRLIRNDLTNFKYDILKWFFGLLLAQTAILIVMMGIGVEI